MAKQENIFVNVVSEFDGKALTKGQKQLSAFEVVAKKLGKTLIAAFAVNEIKKFGQSSIKAYTDSEKSAKALNITLKNTGSLLAFPDAIANIRKLSLATGVADDVLTNAFTQLYSSTGDATQAQKDLALAIDVSKGTTNDLNTVVDALTAGYRGNTKGLGNLNAGLDTATLATKDMVKITKQLGVLQGGQAAAYAETFAGKMDIIKVSVDDAKQSIGKGLMGALEQLAGATGVDKLSGSIQNLGVYLEAVIIRFGELAKMASDSSVGGIFGTVFQKIGDVLALSLDGWSKILGVNKAVLEVQNEIWRKNTKAYEDAYKLQAAQNKINAAYKARLKLLEQEKAAALALKKAKSLFDIDQIEIMAALQGKLTDDEKLRLSLQLALIQDNASEAQRLGKELAISQLQTTNLATAIANIPPALNPFKGWGSEIDNLLAKMIEMYRLLNTPIYVTQPNNSNVPFNTSPSATTGTPPLADLSIGTSPDFFGPNTSPNYNLNPTTPLYQYNSLAQLAPTPQINLTLNVDGSDFARAVQNAQLDINKSGLPVIPAGQGF